MASKNSKKVKATTFAWVMVLLVLCVAIPLNLIASKLDISWDMTPSKLYSLTDESKEYLDELDEENIKVNLYFLSTMEELSEDEESMAFYNLLKQYKKYDCINFEDFDPDVDPEKVDALNPDGYLNLTTADIVVEYNGTIKKVSSSLMYSYYGEYDDNGDFQTTSAYFTAENYITGAIKSAVTGITPTVYFATGHGEHSLDDEYTKFTANLNNYNYDADTVNIGEEGKIPDDTALIIFAGPTSDISEEEYDIIEEYLDDGGNISFMMDPEDTDEEYTYIQKIMNEYCLGMEFDKVEETNNSYYIENDPSNIICQLAEYTQSEEDETETESNYDYQGIAEMSDDSSDKPDLTTALIDKGTTTCMPASRSFYQYGGENYSSVVMDSLILSQTSAVGKPYGGTNDDPDDITDEDYGLVLSAYSWDQSRNNSKMTVFGTSEFFTDDNLNTDYYINPVYLLLSTISWMYSNNVDMGIEDKENTYDQITFTGESQAKGLMGVFIAAPIVFAAIGVGVWLRRRHS